MEHRERDIRYRLSVRESDGTIKRIGYMYQGRYCKYIKGSKHIYKTTNSIGIDAEAFLTEIRLFCDDIRIYDTDTDILYTCPVSTFDKLKTYLHFKPHRAQVFLKIKHFNQIKKKK